MAKEEEKIFLPTQPAELRAGEPVDVQDMIMFFVQKEDKGVEGFRRDESHYEPVNMMREVTVNKKSPVKRNWFKANVYSKLAL